MGRLLPALAATLALTITTAVGGAPAPAFADPNVQPVGSIPIPDGPAPAWIVADMDSGQVLDGRDMYAAHPPASTLKTLLALTALDRVEAGLASRGLGFFIGQEFVWTGQDGALGESDARGAVRLTDWLVAHGRIAVACEIELTGFGTVSVEPVGPGGLRVHRV